jgi:hypothetical protein
MNDPTSVAEQAQRQTDAAGKRGAMMTTARRCAYVTVLILVFLVFGVGGTPSSKIRAQEPLTMEHGPLVHGFTLPTVGEPASAGTLAGANQELVDECGCYEGKFSTSLIRHKTH